MDTVSGPQQRIENIHIKGFRSLADVQISKLPAVTVMIGANGSGKSNLIRFFEMLSWMLKSGQLGEFVARQGGADDQLFGGSKQTPRLEASVRISTVSGLNDYKFDLSHAHPDRLIFTDEAFRFTRAGYGTEAEWEHLGSGHDEAKITKAAKPWTDFDVNPMTASVIVHLLRDCGTYQFHDTSGDSHFKKRWDVEDNDILRSHGGNLAAVLYRLEREDIDRFDTICRHISRILPVFDRFAIEESHGKVLLRWKGKGIDKTFGAHLTSDGSLRFFSLVTLLNLPSEMLPNVVLLDEPELGLHPAAIGLLAGMIKRLGHDKQVIVATQSPLLVDEFEVDEIMVLDLEDGKTSLRKLNAEEYRVWIEQDYTSGQLWRKNLLGGRP